MHNNGTDSGRSLQLALRMNVGPGKVQHEHVQTALFTATFRTRARKRGRIDSHTGRDTNIPTINLYAIAVITHSAATLPISLLAHIKTTWMTQNEKDALLAAPKSIPAS